MEEFGTLTKQELAALARGHLVLSREARVSKATMIAHIVTNGSDELLASMRRSVFEKEESRKRRRADTQQERRVAQRTEVTAPRSVDPSCYLQLPSEEQRKECSRQFLAATSNAALATAVCAVCAREVGVADDHVEEHRLDSFANRARLQPARPHPMHTLYQGCLLEPAGVRVDGGHIHVKTCRSCREELRKQRTQPPRFSLANDLWLGSVPDQLKILTIPEQLLIAQLFPRVYVFKLYPKTPGYRPPSETLQRGMRGTVSTYELHGQGVADMVDGGLLPRLPSVLASVISVTFMGIGPLPKQWLRTTFRVRRPVVAEALRVLQLQHRHYASITISEERLQALPDDDVPDELLRVMRQSPDGDVALQEHGGYVPEDDEEDPTAPETTTSHASASNTGRDDSAGPDVIPLHISGSVDTDLTRMTANEMMLWGLQNLWTTTGEGGYSVRHGRQPVSDFGRPLRSESHADDLPNTEAMPPNYFERAFPCLFPCGVGGMEGLQSVRLSLSEHVQWAMLYHDRRFRTHETFPFVAFGIQQRRQALGSARIQMKRRTFDQEVAILSSITTASLRRASELEANNLPITDPAILLLKRLVHGAAGRVQGTDAGRYKIRSQIWSTCLVFGAPSMWITINPSDIHDPVAQVFAGADIDLDNFLSRMGPNADERAKAIADDPFAAARFFHFLIRTLCETVFQIRVTPYAVKTSMGVLGHPSAFVGAVESQGRGSLHLHMLLWLENTPRTDELHDMLQDAAFRARVVAYITANLRAYLPGLDSAQTVRGIPKEKDISYSRPPHPDSPGYEAEVQNYELRLARAQQIHTCKIGRCLRYDHKGNLSCKRRAPFEASDTDYVTAEGRWGQKRLNRYVNGWIPAVLVNGRCNNDGKLLTNGSDTKNITFYVSSYAGKKQAKNHNLSAIMADGFTYHEDHPRPEYVANLREQHRLLLFRLVNAVNREQELAGPMVVSYLMGWGDVKTSHTYSPLFWSSFVGALVRAHPNINRPGRPDSEVADSSGEHTMIDAAETRSREEVAEDADAEDAQAGNEQVTLEVGAHGRLYAKSQVTDYMLRGTELESYSLFQFIQDTYEADLSPKEREQAEAQEDADTARRPGRPRHLRSQYLSHHPCCQSKQRVFRAAGHRNLVNVVGRWFPRDDDPELREYYCASMLMLLQPWRVLSLDLKPAERTWDDAFRVFMETATPAVRYAVDGVRYFHQCALAADADRKDEDAPEIAGRRRRGDDEMDDEREDVAEPTSENGSPIYTEEALAVLKATQTSYAEKAHAVHAVALAKRAGYFADVADVGWDAAGAKPVGVASGGDLVKLQAWRSQLASDVAAQQQGLVAEGAQRAGAPPDVLHGLPDSSAAASVAHISDAEVEAALEAVDVSCLRPDQYRAFDIITWHLDTALSGADVPPLRMVLYGEGGTGKSRVIQTVTQAFAARGCAHMLVKAAYTGIAASLIDGKTTHVIAQIRVGSDEGPSDTGKKLLQAFWRGRRYLIIDEFSMLSKSFFALLSRHIAAGMEGSDMDSSRSFGGLNVILCGDLHQFPPVASSLSEALFSRTDIARDSGKPNRILGGLIYDEFTTVVILKEQMRVSDPVWRDFLVHLRYGKVTAEHLKMLRTLIMRPQSENTPADMSSEIWKTASLVTPRHAVRTDWNVEGVRKWCRAQGERVYVVTARDRIQKKKLTLAERCAVAGRPHRQQGQKKRRCKDLPETLELAIGMQVMVTSNIQTDLDLANGARGEIVDIVLHPDEPPLSAGPIVHLQELPPYVLVRMHRTRASQLDDLELGVVPVEPIQSRMQIQISHPGTPPVKRSVCRQQFPITAAYAFTDYRSQGQTIPAVIVDIMSPPGPKPLSLFNLYVALSRSSGRETIRLQRDFDDRPFLEKHNDELLAEDVKLEKLDADTKALWVQMGRDSRQSGPGMD